MQLARLKCITGPLHRSLAGGLGGKSTADAVETLVGMASDACYNRSAPRTLNLTHCYAFFIDYGKAFELADPDSILHLLAVDKGIKGHLLGWFNDFYKTGRATPVFKGKNQTFSRCIKGHHKVPSLVLFCSIF